MTLSGLVSPRATGIWGLCATAAIFGAVLISIPTYPGYSPLFKYISELADPINPRAWIFGLGLVAGGLLLLPFAIGLGRLLGPPHGRWVARLSLVAGLTMCLVGIFDLGQPLPHFIVAAVMFAAAIFAEILVAVALRRRSRAAFVVVLGVAVFQILCAVAGFIFTGILVARMEVTSSQQLLRDLPARQTIDLGEAFPLFNPVAFMEWAFLVTAMALVVGGSLIALRRVSAPPSAR